MRSSCRWAQWDISAAHVGHRVVCYSMSVTWQADLQHIAAKLSSAVLLCEPCDVHSLALCTGQWQFTFEIIATTMHEDAPSSPWRPHGQVVLQRASTTSWPWRGHAGTSKARAQHGQYKGTGSGTPLATGPNPSHNQPPLVVDCFICTMCARPARCTEQAYAARYCSLLHTNSTSPTSPINPTNHSLTPPSNPTVPTSRAAGGDILQQNRRIGALLAWAVQVGQHLLLAGRRQRGQWRHVRLQSIRCVPAMVVQLQCTSGIERGCCQTSQLPVWTAHRPSADVALPVA